jgi:glucan phosphoethanolaminetransferase (alkaline phosphatase superfamily)
VEGQATVFIVSDHGEAFGFENSIMHGSVTASAEEQHIAMFFWANRSFIDANSGQWKWLRANADSVVGNDAIFHTSADLYGILSPAVNLERSFARKGYALRTSARVLAGMTRLVPVRVQ